MKKFFILFLAILILSTGCTSTGELNDYAQNEGTDADLENSEETASSEIFSESENASVSESSAIGTDIIEKEKNSTAKTNAVANNGSEILDVNVESTISGMTLKEKIYQLFILTPEQLTGSSAITSAGNEFADALSKRPVGGLIFFSSNIVDPVQTSEMLEKIQNYAREDEGLPLFLAIDEEGGKVSRLAKNSAFNLRNIGSMSKIRNVKEAYAAGNYIGKYLSDYGFNLDFAPDADVLSASANKVIGDRSFGSNPQTVSEYAKAYSDGLHSNGILSTFKHYPGHGGTIEDSHKDYAYSDKSYEELLKSDLIPFINANDYGVDCIMVAHVSLPNIIGDDTPCSLSPVMVQGELRDKFSYKGLIITDALNMGAISKHYSAGEAAKLAFIAGSDLLLMPSDIDSAYNEILKAVNSGEISEERINESLRRILTVKENL